MANSPNKKNILNKSQSVLYAEVILFVAVYISIGYFFKLKPGAYVLAGIPLTLFFQLVIRKQPVYKLWVRDEERFYLNKYGWIITLCFIIFPLYKIVTGVSDNKLTPVLFGINLATIAGAFCAGYSYSRLTKKTTNNLLFCFASAAVIRSAMYLVPLLIGKKEIQVDYLLGIQSLLVYIPIAFVVEEVVFRGMLDTHIYSGKNKNGFWSAVFISSLWGLWHLPITPAEGNPLWFIIIARIVISTWGILLSIFWRRSGNLTVPGFSHAFADAVRDMLTH